MQLSDEHGLVANRLVVVKLDTCEVDSLLSLIISKFDGKHAYYM